MPDTIQGPVLVVGATGMLGGVIARRLLKAGVPTRALGRNAAKLESLKALGANTVGVDLLDRDAIARACEGIAQIVSTANSVLGAGAASPARVDVQAYQNLCAAAKQAGVTRLVHISARDISADSPVDYFRVKVKVDGVIKAGGVPYVLLRATAFMDIWVDQIIADGMRTKGVAMLFGPGSTVRNYVAVDDVAAFAERVLARLDIVNEVIDIGGPSDIAAVDIVQLLEKAMGKQVKRRHIPTFVLRNAPTVVRPFSEVTARMMSLGYYSTLGDTRFPDWRTNADRLGVTPRSMETYIAERYKA